MDRTATRAPRHELRLLAITIVVSAAMLFLLARLRFPDDSRLAPEPAPAAPPLQRLAAQATYDELAGILRDLHRQIAPSVAVVQTEPSGGFRTSTAEGPVTAVRIGGGRAVALVGTGRRLRPSPNNTMALLAFDEPRGLALLDASADSAGAPALELTTIDAAPGYLAAVEATRDGPAVRPMYFGRVDRGADPRWGDDVLTFSGLQQMLPAGCAVFTLQGAFVGIGMPDRGDFVVLPGEVLMRDAERLAHDGSVAAVNPGIEVQRLDARLRAASGADRGVIVTDVDPRGPSAGVIAPGDVIEEITGVRIETPEDFAGASMRLARSKLAAIVLLRRGERQTVTVDMSRTSGAPPAADDPGLDLRTVRGRGAEVTRVVPHSPAARAGLVEGDVIETVDGREAPTPAVVVSAYREKKEGSLLLRVQRGSSHLFVALGRQ
jgi:hypothetical protein